VYCGMANEPSDPKVSYSSSCAAVLSKRTQGRGRRDAAPAPATTPKNSEEGPTGGRTLDSHGSGNAMLIGDDLESASIRSAHMLPRRSMMFDQSRRCASAMACQCRQTCATPGTQYNVVFLTGLLEGARVDVVCEGSPCSMESEQRNKNGGAHYSPGVDRAASFDPETDDGSWSE
jgi:hypothetical protein